VEKEGDDEALAEGAVEAGAEVKVEALIIGNQGARITGERETVGLLMMNPTKSCED